MNNRSLSMYTQHPQTMQCIMLHHTKGKVIRISLEEKLQKRECKHFPIYVNDMELIGMTAIRPHVISFHSLLLP